MGVSHTHADQPEWLHGDPHEPNLTPPDGDGSFLLTAAGCQTAVTVDRLRTLPFTEIGNCFIVSTGHGVSGPFVFGGVLLADFLAHFLPADQHWRFVDIVSVDGFGTRLTPADLAAPRPPLLAWQIDHTAMNRKQGLVRLIVPGEVNDALRQVKWIDCIRVE